MANSGHTFRGKYKKQAGGSSPPSARFRHSALCESPMWIELTGNAPFECETQPILSFTANCAAASRATGTRKGEQET